MSKESEIREAIKKIAGTARSKGSFLTGKVVSVEGNRCTVKCGVLLFEDVRLVVDDESESFVRITPAVDSAVLMVDLSGEERRDLLVIAYSAIDNIAVKNDNNDLKSILNTLISELKAAIIQTPAGPGNFSPATTAKFDQVDVKINDLLSDGTS